MESLSQIYEAVYEYIFPNNPPIPPASHAWISHHYPRVSLAAAGIISLAELPTIARRTAFTGTSSFLDALILCPGLHRQLDATKLNGGEYPACAAMTTGYVFRVENQATVFYLQNVGRPGCLTCLTVSNSQGGKWSWLRAASGVYEGTSLIAAIAYVSPAALTVVALTLLAFLEDWCGFAVVGILILTRLINVLVIRCRARIGWKGQPEPDEQSDLIVLLSQDRWIRIRGAVDDVKAVTSGEWLREPTFFQSFLSSVATLMVYFDVVAAANSSLEGNVVLVVLLITSAGLLGLANHYTEVSNMYGRTIRPAGPPQQYSRRLVLTRSLIKETGRSDWAVSLGMIKEDDDEETINTERNGRLRSSTRRRVDLKATM